MVRKAKKFGVRLWRMVREPKVVSVAYFFIYLALFVGGLSALIEPPTTIAGSVGSFSMYTLAFLLTFGGLLGAPSALVGVWWAERVALLSVGVSSLIYGGVVASLHVTHDGNRLLQLSFIVVVVLMQLVRWQRIWLRPYDPDRYI